MRKMKLNNNPFNLVKDGHKTIEVRLNDEKRRLLNIGDHIEFTNIKTNERIKVVVIDLLKYKTFKELFNNYEPFYFGGNNKEILLNNIMSYYSIAQEKKFGVLGIKIKIIEW